ncbi:Crp/Fnr family transcriptional regulator [Candidatus Microgenomates bacterium]|nr:Crp/Fnr family transcriptional regulator [Candidatus Microgenomates bacterium]
MNGVVVKKLNLFFSKYAAHEYKKGETLIRPDEDMQYIYFLENGFVGQYSFTENGNKIAIHIFKPMSFFPIMLILAGRENQYYFETITQSSIRKAPKPDVLEFLHKNTDVAWDLLERFALGLNGLAERLGHLMFTDRYKRVVALIVWLTKGFGENEGGKVIIQFPISHDNLAAWVNMARETTSRQIEVLEKKKLIEYKDHHIVIPSLKSLEKELD